MQTLQGMLAQTIHEDRIRGYEDPSRLHRMQTTRATTRTTTRTTLLRKLLVRSIGRFGRPATAEPISAPAQS